MEYCRVGSFMLVVDPMWRQERCSLYWTISRHFVSKYFHVMSDEQKFDTLEPLLARGIARLRAVRRLLAIWVEEVRRGLCWKRKK